MEHCYTGYKDAYVTACHRSQFGCGDGPTTCPPGEIPSDCHVPAERLPLCNGLHPPGVSVACRGLPVQSIKPSEGKGSGPICAAGNCTSVHTPTKVDCTKNPSDSSCQQQQQHTAAYLQALNSGSPNPYKPGTKDYEHYQAGLVARQQNNGAIVGITPGGTNGNNNNPSPLTKKCPDGSTIPVKDKCPTAQPSLSNPSNNNNQPSNNLVPNNAPTNNNLQPPGNTPPSNNGNTGSGETGGSNSSPQPSTGASSNSNVGEGDSSNSGSSNGHSSDSDHDGGDSSGKGDSDDSKSSSSSNQ